ncbi:MAG: AtpZ/AtpI family protein [Balneolales bacterium]
MKGLYAVSKYLGLGFQIAGTMIVPVLIGIFIDKQFETTPFGVIAGSLLGFVGLFAFIYKLAIELQNSNDKPKRKPNP